MNGYGLVTHCCRLSIAANMRSGRICGTSMHLRPRLPNGSKSFVRTSVEHYSKSGCGRKNANRPKLDEQLRLKRRTQLEQEPQQPVKPWLLPLIGAIVAA